MIAEDDDNSNIVMQRLETLNERLAQAEVQRTAAEARYANLRRARTLFRSTKCALAVLCATWNADTWI